MQLLFSLLNIMFILPWERALSLQRDGVPELPGETHQDPQHPPLSFRGSAHFLGWGFREVGHQTLGTALCTLATAS